MNGEELRTSRIEAAEDQSSANLSLMPRQNSARCVNLASSCSLEKHLLELRHGSHYAWRSPSRQRMKLHVRGNESGCARS